MRVSRTVGALCAITTLAVLYAIALGLASTVQTRMIYAGAGRVVETLPDGWIRVQMGTGTHANTRYEHRAAQGRPTIIFLHGNATGVAGSANALAGPISTGMGAVVPEYPGYAGEPGRPDERGLADAALAAYDSLVQQGVNANRIAIYGNSIGAGPAIALAASRPHCALVVVSGVADMHQVVSTRFPLPFPDALLTDHYRNAAAMAHVRGPVLVMHAVDDDVVPYAQGRSLATAAHARLVRFDHGGHHIAFEPATSAMISRWVATRCGTGMRRAGDPRGRSDLTVTRE